NVMKNLRLLVMDIDFYFNFFSYFLRKTKAILLKFGKGIINVITRRNGSRWSPFRTGSWNLCYLGKFDNT
ncbi:MAG: hypothetical protein WA125_15775, partial [Desulfosporosinus sp.]